MAAIFGKAVAPNLMLLFLPLPHCSFITVLAGVSRARLVRYHRCAAAAPLLWLDAAGGPPAACGARQQHGARCRTPTCTRATPLPHPPLRPRRSWLGHGTLWVLSIHAVLYYIVWGARQE